MSQNAREHTDCHTVEQRQWFQSVIIDLQAAGELSENRHCWSRAIQVVCSRKFTVGLPIGDVCGTSVQEIMLN